MRSTPSSERGGAPQAYPIQHASQRLDSLANASASGGRSALASAYAKSQPPHRLSLRGALAPCIPAQPTQPQPSIAAKTLQAEPRQSVASQAQRRTYARAEHTQSTRWRLRRFTHIGGIVTDHGATARATRSTPRAPRILDWGEAPTQRRQRRAAKAITSRLGAIPTAPHRWYIAKHSRRSRAASASAN